MNDRETRCYSGEVRAEQYDNAPTHILGYGSVFNSRSEPLWGFREIIKPGAFAVKWSTKTGHRVRVFSSIDFPIRLVVTHHYIRAVLVRCNIQRYSPLLRELHR